MASLPRRMVAESAGTFGFIFIGCGVAVLGNCKPVTESGLLCLAAAFGLAAFAMMRVVGPISGAHLNPAISLGLAFARRFCWREVLPYVFAQVLGAASAGLVLMLAAQGRPDFHPGVHGFAANGYGAHSPAGFDVTSALAVEFAATGMLVLVMASVTQTGRLKRAGAMAGGPAVAVAHLLTLPVTHAGLNPARATGMALFVQDWAVQQLWLFWLAPALGAMFGGLLAYCVLDEQGTMAPPDDFTPLAPWPDEPVARAYGGPIGGAAAGAAAAQPVESGGGDSRTGGRAVVPHHALSSTAAAHADTARPASGRLPRPVPTLHAGTRRRRRHRSAGVGESPAVTRS